MKWKLACIIISLFQIILYVNCNGCGEDVFDKKAQNLKSTLRQRRATSVQEMKVTADAVCKKLETDKANNFRYCKKRGMIGTVYMLHEFVRSCQQKKLENKTWFSPKMAQVNRMQDCHSKYCPLGQKYKAFNDRLKSEFNCLETNIFGYLYSTVNFITPLSNLTDCKKSTYLFRRKYLPEVLQLCKREAAQKAMDIVGTTLDEITKMKCKLSMFLGSHKQYRDKNWNKTLTDDEDFAHQVLPSWRLYLICFVYYSVYNFIVWIF